MVLSGDTRPGSALTRWFQAFRDDVLSGRVSLDDLLDAADDDMRAESHELCPVCARHVMRKGAGGYQHGTCAVCWLHHLRDAHLEELARLEAQKEYNAAKKQLQRERDGQDPSRERKPGPWKRAEVSRGHAGFMLEPGEPLPFEYCEVCGEPFRQHTGGDDTKVCPECRARRERRHA